MQISSIHYKLLIELSLSPPTTTTLFVLLSYFIFYVLCFYRMYSSSDAIDHILNLKQAPQKLCDLKTMEAAQTDGEGARVLTPPRRQVEIM